MASVDQAEPRGNPNGAFFVSGESLPLWNTQEELFEQSVTFSKLAYSGTLENPKAALARAETLFDYAVGLGSNSVNGLDD